MMAAQLSLWGYTGVLVCALLLLRARRARDVKRSSSTSATRLQQGSRLVVMGSGSSGGTPLLACMIGAFPGTKMGGCDVCRLASVYKMSEGQLVANKNRRGNPSLLILFDHPDGRRRHILIDVGKTFREIALVQFPQHDVDGIDAVLLTHLHSDSCHGFDELRCAQRQLAFVDSSTGTTDGSNGKSDGRDRHWLVRQLQPIDAFATAETTAYMKAAFPYCFPREGGGAARSEKLSARPDAGGDGAVPTENAKQPAIPRFVPKILSARPDAGGGGAVPTENAKQPAIPRFVPKIRWTELDYFQSVDVHGLKVVPLPVEHGFDFICTAYALGSGDGWCLYISDVSEVPRRTMEYVKERQKAERLDILFVDSSCWRRDPRRPPVHFDIEDAIKLTAQIRPMRTVITGIGHQIEHNRDGAKLQSHALKQHGLAMQLGFDGMVLDVNLS